jgi:hypothetical protein
MRCYSGWKCVIPNHHWLLHFRLESASYDSERERLLEANRQLEISMTEIKTLEGLLPICAGCKKIREDDGSWVHVEQYISDNSDASFSHGMCPDCISHYYPEYTAGKKAEKI